MRTNRLSPLSWVGSQDQLQSWRWSHREWSRRQTHPPEQRAGEETGERGGNLGQFLDQPLWTNNHFNFWLIKKKNIWLTAWRRTAADNIYLLVVQLPSQNLRSHPIGWTHDSQWLLLYTITATDHKVWLRSGCGPPQHWGWKWTVQVQNKPVCMCRSELLTSCSKIWHVTTSSILIWILFFVSVYWHLTFNPVNTSGLTCNQGSSLPGRSPRPLQWTHRCHSGPSSSAEGEEPEVRGVLEEETSKDSGLLYLGGEVSVEDALAVQVLQPSGDVPRQTDPDAPGQEQVAVQQLLQVSSIYVLYRRKQNTWVHCCTLNIFGKITFFDTSNNKHYITCMVWGKEDILKPSFSRVAPETYKKYLIFQTIKRAEININHMVLPQSEREVDLHGHKPQETWKKKKSLWLHRGGEGGQNHHCSTL